MSAITAILHQEKYRTRLISDTNEIVADEPLDLGGTDTGFSPYELLSGALASCTAITLRMYADRNAWDLREVKVVVDFERDKENNLTRIDRKITLEGDLDEKQRAKLLAIANACPTHRILTGKIEVGTELN